MSPNPCRCVRRTNVSDWLMLNTLDWGTYLYGPTLVMFVSHPTWPMVPRAGSRWTTQIYQESQVHAVWGRLSWNIAGVACAVFFFVFRQIFESFIFSGYLGFGIPNSKKKNARTHILRERVDTGSKNMGAKSQCVKISKNTVNLWACVRKTCVICPAKKTHNRTHTLQGLTEQVQKFMMYL